MFGKREGLLTAIVVTGLFACSSDDDKKAGVSWSACEEGATLECANIEVPMNYSDTAGEKISLALIRKPAPAETRRGALLFNPGGPGGSGVELIQSFEEEASIPASVLAAYDIVGFDPRGVGGSTPVDCSELQDADIDAYPTTDDAVRELHQLLSELATGCVNKEGAYLQQLGSMNVVRDMDEIRRAMGEDELNFIGYSYGTRLAALYLQTYPQHSGRIVLDGSVLPNSSVTQLISESLPSLQSNLRLFLSQCTNTDPDCNVDQLITRLTDRVSALSNDDTEAGQEEFEVFGELVVISAQEPEFGLFAADAIIEYLNSYDVGVLEQFIQLLDALGQDFEDDDSDGVTAQTAVMCADDAYRPTADELITLLTQMNTVSDPFAEAQLAVAGLCAGWPQAIEPLAPIATSTAPMSIVIGGTTDAQTPVQWSETMAQAIGGTYIRSEHPGHTVVFTDQSECVDDLVEQFLADGLAPAVTQCN